MSADSNFARQILVNLEKALWKKEILKEGRYIQKFDENCEHYHDGGQGHVNFFLIDSQKTHKNDLSQNQAVERVAAKSDENQTSVSFVILCVHVQ